MVTDMVDVMARTEIYCFSRIFWLGMSCKNKPENVLNEISCRFISFFLIFLLFFCEFSQIEIEIWHVLGEMCDTHEALNAITNRENGA